MRKGLFKVSVLGIAVWVSYLGAALGEAFAQEVASSATVVDYPDTSQTNRFYPGNRPPLLPSPFIKLPIGDIKPQGWVRKQLELQADGFTGHLNEISRFLKKENNAWLSKKGKGNHSWEEVPYWLKGFGDTGYVLGDERIVKEARIWIEAMIASQRRDGYFGPRDVLRRLQDKPDLWGNMIALFALQSYYEYSGDKRVLDLMTKYFRWEMTLDDEDFLEPFWQQQRAADNLFSVYWLYNITGDESLLTLAEKIHRNTAKWSEGVANWHNVNIAQAFRGPATFYMQCKDEKFLQATERNYDEVMSIYGQVPGGCFGGDENCRSGYTGPRQAMETCGMVELMLSHELMLRITGEPKWADRCEDVAFNSFPAALTADLKALRYLTAPNMPLSDSQDKSPGLQNGGPMLLMDPHGHRCCQHNAGHGWPYYAEHLWMATPDNGLAAVLYAPSVVTARIGDGTVVTIAETTKYPFEERIEFLVRMNKSARFPLYFRVPGWCDNSLVQLNGMQVMVNAQPGKYVAITRTWANGDRVSIKLPMDVRLRTWTENKHCVSVDRGPLTYSLKIGEDYVRAGGTDDWPAWEIHPTTPWNYGLVLDSEQPEENFRFQRFAWPESDQPFEAESSPITLRVRARKIPAWELDYKGLIGRMEHSPVASMEPDEVVTLIPMGAARLRISAFPVIGDTMVAAAPTDETSTEEETLHEWTPQPPPRPWSASHQHDYITAVADNIEPYNSADQSIPRFTWYPHTGTEEWIQWTFESPRRVSGVKVYWYDDTGMGQCRVPLEWHVRYREGAEWHKVDKPGKYGIERDIYNHATFQAVTTDAIRVVVQLPPDCSGGILEWRVK